MPSFDVVSEVDMHELSNAVDQANREVNTRFDFKGSDAKFEHSDAELSLIAQSEFQLDQMMKQRIANLIQKLLNRRGFLQSLLSYQIFHVLLKI